VSAVYVAEWEFSADGDGSDAQTFKKRNLFGGLKFTNVGTLKAGILTLISKMLLENIKISLMITPLISQT
jgi:predicted porin